MTAFRFEEDGYVKYDLREPFRKVVNPNKIRSEPIINHNIGNSALSYNFYNNITGQYLAQDDVLRAFDNVPIFSQTHEVSKSRYFLANNIEGYNTPTNTSLQVAMSNITNISIPNPPFTIFSYKFKAGTRAYTGDINVPFSYYQYRWSYWGYYIWVTANTPNGIKTGYFELSRNYNLDNGWSIKSLNFQFD